jgi:5'-nucleotidase
MGKLVTSALALLLALAICHVAFGQVSFTILHTGDTRGNYLPTNVASLLECAPTHGMTPTQIQALSLNCLGGWDMRARYINDVRSAYGAGNVLLLDAGDLESGTLFFQKYKYEMPATYTAQAGYHAVGVGARDFDGGKTDFQAMVDSMQTGGVATVTINLNFTSAGTGYQAVLTNKVFTVQGVDVLVIGLTNLRIESLTRLPAGIQAYAESDTRSRIIEAIGASGANIVILLSKQSSFDEDLTFIRAAGLTTFVDVVISSYSSEMMWSPNPLKANGRGCAGSGIRFCTQQYPYNTTSAGKTMVMAAAAPFGMGIGLLNVTFDASGTLTDFSGESVLLNRTLLPTDAAIELDIYNRKLEVTEFAGSTVAETPVLLIGDGSDVDRPCRWTQCSMGMLTADAMLNTSANLDVAIISGGSVRANISEGNITYGDILQSLPFLNLISTFDVTGDTLLQMLNSALKNTFISGSGRFPQVAGLKFEWNINLPNTGNRIISLSVLDRSTGQYQPLDTLNTYRVATTNFVFNGGDGYGTWLPSQAKNVLPYGPALTDTVIDFINARNAEDDTSYFGELLNEQRIVPTDLTEAFVPTVQPIIIVHRSIPDGLSAAFTVITGVLSVITILVGAYIFYHRKHAVTVIASAVFCLLILGGVLLSHLAIQIFIHLRNNAGCMIFPWLGNYAFVIIFGALFAKTWRMDMIFARTKKLRTKKRAISSFLLFVVIGILLLIETFIMGLWQGLSPLKYNLVVDQDRRESRYSCNSKNGVYFFAASIAYKGLLMLWGMYLVIKTRNIDSDFRESTFIGWVIFAVFFTCAVIVTICLILRTNVVGVFVLVCIGFWIVSASVIGAIFVPKLIEIFSHPDLVWATYFQKRAENLRQGTGSVFTKHQSIAHDSIQDRMDGMSLVGLQSLLEEYEMRETSLKSSIAEIGKDLTAIRAKIAKKQGSGPSRRDLGSPARRPPAKP